MTNIVLCGGVGSRLWPLSRAHVPKQFARILPGDSLFEATVKRNRGLCARLLVASNKDQFYLAANQLAGIGVAEWDAMIEPVGRNTAPAIALACMMLGAEELVLVTPSDHLIANEAAYRRAVERAEALAGTGALVTFGVKPLRPETGFGYIEAEGERVRSFKEKPDRPTAEAYLRAGNYYWNAGMFCFKAGAFLEELARHAPEVHAAARRAFEAAPNKRPLGVDPAAMAAIPSISVDYAVMERSAKVACVPCPEDLGWSDLGSFDAIYEGAADAAGDAILAKEPPVAVGSRGNLVIEDYRRVALVDVEDLIIVGTPDALLVAKRGSSQKVKEVYDALSAGGSSLVSTFPRVERPWGSYLVLHEGEDCKVKRIEVLPGQRLSLQRHQHREEHWTVVKGRSIVQIEESRKSVDAGEGIFIPKHATHRLENPGDGVLVLIETQIGAYLGEDDIERFHDDYARE